jgi:hypothetical protein
VRTGADAADPGDEVVVDLRFEPAPDGTLLAAALDAGGAVGTPFQVFAAVDDGDPGVWGLSPEGCDAVGTALARGQVGAVLADARAASA